MGVGVITYRAGGVTKPCWAGVSPLQDKVTILAETAERPEEIDVARAQQAKERAEQLLKSNDPELDYDSAQDDLRRAETRLKVATEK